MVLEHHRPLKNKNRNKKPRHKLFVMYKINWKWIKGLNVKAKTKKFLEKICEL